MNRKHILGWLAVPIMALALVGCGQKDGKSPDQKAQQAGLSKKELSDLGEKVLKDTYKKYDDKKACWITEGPDKVNYCMKVASVESVMTEEGEKVYLLATGESADGAENGHGSAMVGMFAVKPENGEYKVIAQGQNAETTSGKAPEGEFVQLGKNVYGWQIAKSASDQGQNSAGVEFFAVQNDQVKDIGGVATVYDDSAMSEAADKVKHSAKLEGKVEVDKTDENAEHYPISVTVSGEKDGKKLSPRKYAIQFSSQKGKYVAPEDYPIAE